MHYLRAQRLRKAMLAAIYIYPVYVEYGRKFGVKLKSSENSGESPGSLVVTCVKGQKEANTSK